jgi:hypothetical protein
MNEPQALRLLSVLVGYFWRHHIYDIDVRLKPQKESYEIEVSGSAAKAPSDLDEFTRGLQERCQPELADYYDQLLGPDSGDTNAYHLLGAVIDQADITYEELRLTVRIIKATDTRS